MKVDGHKNLSQVFDILDDLNDKSHCVTFYEEPEHARMVEYHFIQTDCRRVNIAYTRPTKTILASSKVEWLILE
jgi:hypothetical protein